MIRTCLFALLLCCFSVQTVKAQELITALNMDPGWVGINGWAHYVGSNDAGQEFTAATSGTLTTLEASIDKFYGDVPLDISFYTSSNGFPGTFLGSASVPPEDFDPWGTTNGPMNQFDVSTANVQVEAGQNYVVVFTAAASGVQYRCIMTSPNANSFGYAYLASWDGSPWEKMTRLNPNVEIGMRLFVVEECLEFPVDIDVLPDTTNNVVRLGKKKPKPFKVIVYGNSNVDVTFVDTTTLRLGDPSIEGGSSVAPYNVQQSDANGDGIDDLSLLFDLTLLESLGAIDVGSAFLELHGELISCDTITGLDLVQPEVKGKGSGKGKGNGNGNNR